MINPFHSAENAFVFYCARLLSRVINSSIYAKPFVDAGSRACPKCTLCTDMRARLMQTLCGAVCGKPSLCSSLRAGVSRKMWATVYAATSFDCEKDSDHLKCTTRKPFQSVNYIIGSEVIKSNEWIS
jgi:hypothetical protein